MSRLKYYLLIVIVNLVLIGLFFIPDVGLFTGGLGYGFVIGYMIGQSTEHQKHNS